MYRLTNSEDYVSNCTSVINDLSSSDSHRYNQNNQNHIKREKLLEVDIDLFENNSNGVNTKHNKFNNPGESTLSHYLDKSLNNF